jgi:hypothetical protein
MRRFLNYWEQKFHSKPPTPQTIRNLRSRHEQQNFEYWLIDGCCRLLLDCTYEEWQAQYQYQGLEVVSERILPDRELINMMRAIADDLNQINILYTDLEQKFKFLCGVIQQKTDRI